MWKKKFKERTEEIDNSKYNRIEKNLKMDYVKLPFKTFFIVYTLIFPGAYFKNLFNIQLLKMKLLLYTNNIIKETDCKKEKVVYSAIIESVSQLIHFRKIENVDGIKYATFIWENFTYLDENKKCNIGDNLIVVLNLNEKKMERAHWGKMSISPNDALIMVTFHTYSSGHVPIHAMSNKSITHINNFLDDTEKWKNDSFTVLYNFFGYTLFRIVTYRNGGYNFREINKVFDRSLIEPIPPHKNIKDIIEYSEIGTFIFKFRPIFMKTFFKHKHLFEKSDPEGMFSAIVQHSLDHYTMEKNIKDPLWLQNDNSSLTTVAELTRVVRVGFVSDIVLPFFVSRKLYSSKHPFYSELYSEAIKINKEYANAIDTCIIK